MLNSLIDRFQAKFPPNRLTAIAMLVLAAPAAALGGYVAVWVPKHFPGLPTFTPKQYTAFLITGGSAVVLAGIAAGYKFIDGCQKDEATRAGAVALRAEHAHAEHLEAMRLESQERVAVASTAESPWHAAEALGLTLPGDDPQAPPSGAVAAVSPPLAPPPVPLPPDPGPTSPAAGEGPGVGLPPRPAVPLPPQAAAQAAQPDPEWQGPVE